MPQNSCIMQIWAESGKSALPICNYSQILYQFLTFTQNLKRSLESAFVMQRGERPIIGSRYKTYEDFDYEEVIIRQSPEETR